MRRELSYRSGEGRSLVAVITHLSHMGYGHCQLRDAPALLMRLPSPFWNAGRPQPSFSLVAIHFVNIRIHASNVVRAQALIVARPPAEPWRGSEDRLEPQEFGEEENGFGGIASP
jgi:hypothetical protein